MDVVEPPPAIKLAADKTAKFFVRNGPSFFEKVRREKGDLPEFVFLKEDHPYNAFYQLCVKKYQENPDLLERKPVATERPPAPPEKSVTEVSAQLARFRERLPIPSTKPLSLDFAISHPSDIDLITLETMKVTAQYVAKNGRTFLATLVKQTSDVPSLSFLNPSSPLFSFFTVLVHNYQKIQKFSTLKDMKERIHNFTLIEQDKFSYLSKIKERAGWDRMQKKKAEETSQLEEESVDWSDFVVVQTVDFD
ncbi:hypothetical protein P9112_001769 [Eukaryota sp. TZLM1-RC]